MKFRCSGYGATVLQRKHRLLFVVDSGILGDLEMPKVLSTKVTEDIYNRFREKAKATNQTPSVLLRKAIMDTLEQKQKPLEHFK